MKEWMTIEQLGEKLGLSYQEALEFAQRPSLKAQNMQNGELCISFEALNTWFEQHEINLNGNWTGEDVMEEEEFDED